MTKSYLQKIVKKPYKLPAIFSRRKKLLNTISLYKNCKLLDVGAGDKWVKNYLSQKKLKFIYKSMDIDRTYAHDFYNISDIKEKFDIVLLFDVVEHLSLDTLSFYLEKIKNLLNPEGKLIISIPNIFYVGKIYHSTYTHIKNYSFFDLYLLLKKNGFESVQIFRLIEKTCKLDWKLPWRILKKVLQIFLCHLFTYLDYATDIIIIGYIKK